MTTVLDFAAAKAARQHRWKATCVCLGCRHEWQGAGTPGEVADLDCPECALPKGVIKNLFGPDEGDLGFRCVCGCDVMTVYQREARRYIQCLACGMDQTLAVYGQA